MGLEEELRSIARDFIAVFKGAKEGKVEIAQPTNRVRRAFDSVFSHDELHALAMPMVMAFVAEFEIVDDGFNRAAMDNAIAFIRELLDEQRQETLGN